MPKTTHGGPSYVHPETGEPVPEAVTAESVAANSAENTQAVRADSEGDRGDDRAVTGQASAQDRAESRDELSGPGALEGAGRGPDTQLERPAGNASADTWREYVAALSDRAELEPPAELDNLTRAQLQAEADQLERAYP